MNFDLRFYWALFLRRLPVMALFVLVISGLGIVTALKLPETYSTSARLLVEAPQIPDSMVASTVQTAASEQLDIIQQRLLTRANLIDIANRFNVFKNIREMEPDDVVEAMRKSTRIRRTSGRDRGGQDQATLMTISFESGSPQVAANVVNEYVTLVLQENARFRVSRAENTLEFFEQEVERLSQDLNRQSQEMSRFKSENANALPQDQAYRLGRQTLLQERLAGLERDLKAAEARRQEIVRIYETTGQVGRDTEPRRLSPEEQRLLSIRAELENAKAIYTETSPQVVRLQAIVDRLQKAVAAKAAEGRVGEGDVTPEQVLLNATLSEIDSRINSLQAEMESTTNELDELQKRISQSAANAIQLADLERDYNNIQTRYNAALSNLNAARMSERVEATAQGQRISVIENANVPRVPSGPNRIKIAIVSILAGIGLAAAYFILLEKLNRTIRRPAELAGKFDITPLVTIPYMESRRTQLFRRTRLLASTLIVVVSVPAVLWYIDTYYLPLELIFQRSLDKFGLG